MAYKIAVYGTGVESDGESAKQAQHIGRAIARAGSVLITGACSGVPYEAAKAAHDEGGQVWGFSPARDFEEQKQQTPNDDLDVYNKLIFTPETFPFSKSLEACKKYRNVISTHSCDAAILIQGRWGTLNEFTNLIDAGKVIGVLTGTGGIADELKGLTERIHKETDGVVLFENDPDVLVAKILAEL